MKVKSLVITGFGINCEKEMAFANQLAGAEVETVHFNELLYGSVKLADYHILNFPGGFSFADELGAAKAFANKIRFATTSNGHKLIERITAFINDGKYIIGICNGFQLMVKLGLLPGFDGNYGEQLVSLTFNARARFVNRWVYQTIHQDSPCIFTKGLNSIYLPIRHGEGRFIVRNEEVLAQLWKNHQVVLQYATPELQPTQEFPHNPNGSVDAIAGICDATGRVFGMMAHPEAFLFFYNHPRWTRLKEELRKQNQSIPDQGAGLQVFKNVVNHAREHLS